MIRREIFHKGLNKSRVIRGQDEQIVNQKIDIQIQVWDEEWAKKKEKKQLSENRNASKAWAEHQSDEARKSLKEIDNILLHTLEINDEIDWDLLKDTSDFAEKEPQPPVKKSEIEKPDPTATIYKPILVGLDFFNPFAIKREKIKAKERYENAFQQWKKKNEKNEREWTASFKEYEQKKKNWSSEKKSFEERQVNLNLSLQRLKNQYESGEPEAVEEYCDLVLSRSQYPISFPKQFVLKYLPETKMLLVEYRLPDINDLPTLKEIKYVASSDDYKEIFISDATLTRMYDKAIYDILLRTIHEIFESDSINAIDSVTLNGVVQTIDRSIGKEVELCIASIQTFKEEFMQINLKLVDSKVCFKSLKGVASSKLSSLTPIPPIINMNMEDSRFIESREDSVEIDDSINLAAMDWQDFEHLIREVFEKEFSKHGGEVKITQASRDGGVDAVAFDPDPLRGGKIVIQAKRYTNTVGVSAVRDLYGTVMNEGATKGILVSTSDYGPDAYRFAQDKPLTLLNGSNLLHLLQQHGQTATIDLKAAKLEQKKLF